MSGVPASETRATASLAHPRDQAGPHPVGIVVVIGQSSAASTPIWRSSLAVTRLSSTAIRSARASIAAARGLEIGEIADRGRDDIEAGFERVVHREHRHGISSPTARKRGARCLGARRPRRSLSAADRRLRAAPRSAAGRCRPSRCSSPSRAGADAAAAADETRNRVAVLVPLTRRQCRARPVDPQRRQPRLARHRRRAHPDHRLRHRDGGAVAAANEALAEGNGLILGPLLAEDVRAVAPVARAGRRAGDRLLQRRQRRRRRRLS